MRKEQGEAAAERCGAGFYYTDSATTRFISLALPKSGAQLTTFSLSLWLAGHRLAFDALDAERS